MGRNAGLRRRYGALLAGALASLFCALFCALFSALLFAPRSAAAEPAASRAAPESGSVLDLRNLMSHDELGAAGLGKLSDREVAALNRWIGRLVVRLLSGVERAGCSTPIETRMSGEFGGWNGDTVFELENGQVWKQLDYGYSLAHKVTPRVLVYRSGASCKLKVDGVEGEVLVTRVK